MSCRHLPYMRQTFRDDGYRCDLLMPRVKVTDFWHLVNTGRVAPPHPHRLDKTFFLQAYEYPVTDDDVIENLDPDLVARLYQLFRRPDVLLARLWVA